MHRGSNYMPYYPISRFYKNRFGEKVYKIPVSIIDDCPNRRGLKGMKVCIFCDEWGSAAYPQTQALELATQIKIHKKKIQERYKAKSFLIYFQAYTNTFSQVKHLRNCFQQALKEPGVVGLVVGTRPDCLSPAVLRLWNEFSEKTFMSVELGVQSFFDRDLKFLERGHTSQQSIDAIKKIKAETSVDLGIHLMFGQPNETLDQIKKTAEIINDLPIDNVKLHNLHVLRNTPLQEIYDRGEFKPIELEEYTQTVCCFLRHLRPDIPIHRLNAVASNWDELVAPEWTRHKMLATQTILDRLLDHGWEQGDYFKKTTVSCQKTDLTL